MFEVSVHATALRPKLAKHSTSISATIPVSKMPRPT